MLAWYVAAVLASQKLPESLPTRKQQVVNLLKTFETKDPAGYAVINPKKYIQHNLHAANGLASLKAFAAPLPKGAMKVNTVRVFEDGDYVFAHTVYEMGQPSATFDVFRYEQGKIVEHWDNGQVMPAKPNPSGNTMVNGPTEAKDLSKTKANKALVKAFVTDILVKKIDRFDHYVRGEHYIQHNPMIGNGTSAVKKYFSGPWLTSKVDGYTKIEKVLGEGDFVLVMSSGLRGGKSIAAYDLYRVENGKVAEHWDTVEFIPPRSEWKNANGKF